jgi:hypothetical protein
MSDGGASKTLDDLLTAMLEEDDDNEPAELNPAEMKAMVKETTDLIERLHLERTQRRLAAHEQSRKKRAAAIEGYGGPLPSKEQLIVELRGLMQSAGQEARFHAMKFRDAGPEDLAEMIASMRHLLKGRGGAG